MATRKFILNLRSQTEQANHGQNRAGHLFGFLGEKNDAVKARFDVCLTLPPTGPE